MNSEQTDVSYLRKSGQYLAKSLYFQIDLKSLSDPNVDKVQHEGEKAQSNTNPLVKLPWKRTVLPQTNMRKKEKKEKKILSSKQCISSPGAVLYVFLPGSLSSSSSSYSFFSRLDSASLQFVVSGVYLWEAAVSPQYMITIQCVIGLTRSHPLTHTSGRSHTPVRLILRETRWSLLRLSPPHPHPHPPILTPFFMLTFRGLSFHKSEPQTNAAALCELLNPYNPTTQPPAPASTASLKPQLYCPWMCSWTQTQLWTPLWNCHAVGARKTVHPLKVKWPAAGADSLIPVDVQEYSYTTVVSNEYVQLRSLRIVLM